MLATLVGAGGAALPGLALPVGAALCVAAVAFAPGEAKAAADPDCLCQPAAVRRAAARALCDSGSPRSPPAAPAPSQTQPKPEDRARRSTGCSASARPRRELVLRLNRMFWADGDGRHPPVRARSSTATRAAGFETELQVRYHPPEGKAGDMRRLEALRARGRSGSSAGARASSRSRSPTRPTSTSRRTPPTAATRASARRSSRASSPPSASCARSAAATSSSASRSPGAGSRLRPRASGRRSARGRRRGSGAALDYVGLQVYPGLVLPPAIAPGSSAGDEIVEALTLLRHCYMPKAGLGPRLDLWVSENGYATNLGRTEAGQATDARARRSQAVHRWSGTLGVSDYRYFNLRDNDIGRRRPLRRGRPAARRLLAQARLRDVPPGGSARSALTAGPVESRSSEHRLRSHPPRPAALPSLPRCRAAIRVKGLEFERVEMDMGEHNEQMEAIYGAGNRTVPGMLVDGEPVHGSRAIFARLEEIAPDPPLYPEPIADAVREADRWGDEELQDLGRSLPLGRPPLPAGGAGHVRRRRAARSRRHRLRDQLHPRDLEATTGSRAALLAEHLAGLPAKLDHVDELAAAGVIGGERANAADLQIGSTIRVLMTLGDLEPLLGGQRRRARSPCAGSPSTRATSRRAPSRPAGCPPASS